MRTLKTSIFHVLANSCLNLMEFTSLLLIKFSFRFFYLFNFGIENCILDYYKIVKDLNHEILFKKFAKHGVGNG